MGRMGVWHVASMGVSHVGKYGQVWECHMWASMGKYGSCHMWASMGKYGRYLLGGYEASPRLCPRAALLAEPAQLDLLVK